MSHTCASELTHYFYFGSPHPYLSHLQESELASYAAAVVTVLYFAGSVPDSLNPLVLVEQCETHTVFNLMSKPQYLDVILYQGCTDNMHEDWQVIRENSWRYTFKMSKLWPINISARLDGIGIALIEMILLVTRCNACTVQVIFHTLQAYVITCVNDFNTTSNLIGFLKMHRSCLHNMLAITTV